MFYELMRRRGPFCFYAFDLMLLDGKDLRETGRSSSESCTFANSSLGTRSRFFMWIMRRAARNCSSLRPRHGGGYREAGKCQVQQAAGRQDFVDCLKTRHT